MKMIIDKNMDEEKPVRCGCGGSAATLVAPHENWGIYYRVKCWKCGTQTVPKRTKKEAVEAWNRTMGEFYRMDEFCTDCKEYDHEKHCCPRWNRVIKRTVNELKAERKKGNLKCIGFLTSQCSECGAQFHELEYTNFCPNCGADFRGNNE